MRPDTSNPCLRLKRYREEKHESLPNVEGFTRFGRASRIGEAARFVSLALTLYVPRFPARSWGGDDCRGFPGVRAKGEHRQDDGSDGGNAALALRARGEYFAARMLERASTH